MKKVLALVLASAMAVGMAATAFAATNSNTNSAYKAVGFDKDTSLADGYNMGWSNSSKSWDNNYASNQTVTYKKDVVPHDEVKDYIDLTTGMFDSENHYLYVDKDGKYRDKDNNPTDDITKAAYISDQLMSAKDIRNSKLAVRTSVSAGSKAIDEVKIDNKKGRIEIKYVKEYVSTKELDFDFTVYLTFDGKRWNDSGLTFVGTLNNETTEVYAGDDYVDTGYGQIAEAMEFVKDIEVDLGNGVKIFTKMFKDKKYYGTSTRDADDADDIVFAKYADIDNVVTLKTVGLNSTGDIVQLDTDYSDYYVYDKDLNYLGQSNTLLTYSTKYYLANRKLDIVDGQDGEDITEAPETDDGDLDNVPSGGDDGADNANANPSTGR